MTDVVQNPDTTPADTASREHSRTGLSADALRRGILDHLRYSIGRPAAALRPEHYYDDPFLVLADYASYVECQGRVSAAWQDTDAWTRMSILNTARSGKFSSDRAITEYCDDIWNVWPVTVSRPSS